MTNFDFLLAEPEFEAFAEAAVSAEKILHIDPAACVLNCRRAMEFAIRWMYEVDKELDFPYKDNLRSMMNYKAFRGIVGNALWQRMDYIRIKGNSAAHSERELTQAQALLCLENLHAFLDFVAYSYTENYRQRDFDPALVKQQEQPDPAQAQDAAVLRQLQEENAALRERLTARRTAHAGAYVPRAMQLSEYETRKFYIDAMLEDAGWVEGRDWINEAVLPQSDEAADYLLRGDGGQVLAVVEAGRTGEDAFAQQQRAMEIADGIRRQTGERPAVILTNGFETWLLEADAPARRCAAIPSRQDLQRRQLLRRGLLGSAVPDKKVAGRYYQRDAVQTLCRAFEAGTRSGLLAMAPGAGKTRTAIGLCGVLQSHGWARQILFLAEREPLVIQAKRSFEKFLPALTAAVPEDLPTDAPRCVFATYEAMTRDIDSIYDAGDRRYTCGSFDLVICDGLTDGLCRRYRDLLTYFDALTVAMAAPDDLPGVQPLFSGALYSYSPEQALRDGYLVDFVSVRTPQPPTDETGCSQLPDKVISTALEQWLSREDTVAQALRLLLTRGVKTGGGIGKTILFAADKAHAELICRVFDREYPHLRGHMAAVDGTRQGQQATLDAFADPRRLPRIVVSWRALDTGVDIPAVVNLAFFRQVRDRAQLRHMLARGNRPCPGLLDGSDKDLYYVFDFCGNLARLHMEPKSAPQARLFCTQMAVAARLEGTQRRVLAGKLAGQLQALDRNRFSVRQHLKTVEQYSESSRWDALTPETAREAAEELAPLLPPAEETDTLQALFSLLLAKLEGKQADPEPLRVLLEQKASPRLTPYLQRGSLKAADADTLLQIYQLL